MPAKPTWNPYINRSDPLAQGLVGAWFALEGAGTLAHDLSGNGNHGALPTSVSWVRGRRGPVLEFTNPGDGIPFDPVFSGKPSELTVITRSRKIAGGGADRRILSYNTQNQLWLLLRYLDGTQIDFFVNDGGNKSVAFALDATLWFDFAGVAVDGESISLYADGGLVGSTAVGTLGTISSFGRFIGASRVDSLALDGQIDYVYIYDRALPAASIRTLHHDPYALLRPVRRWWAVTLEVEAAGITHPVIGSGVVGSPVIRSNIT